MAEVFLCRLKGPSGFERPVVVKRILPHLAKDPAFEQMFVDEARSLARIHHPNVVQVQEFGREDGDLVLAMEYVAGETLASLRTRLIEVGETLDPRLCAYIVAEACAGLHAAHDLVGDDGVPLGLIHRDVSPQNLIITYDGHVKVLDFGIAFSADRGARTETGEIKGKLEYMSPEQTQGKKLDRRSDIFSLGVVLHEIITGKRLYKREGHALVVQAILDEPAIPPSRIADNCPRLLDLACRRALEKAPSDRYPSAADFRRDLLEAAREIIDPTAVLAGAMHRLFADRITAKSGLVAEPRREKPAPTPRRRRRGVFRSVAVGVAVVLLLTGSLVAWRVSRARTVPSARRMPIAETPDAGGPAIVNVMIATTPAGARVLIDGVYRGDSPLAVALPKGDVPIGLQVERGGFQSVSQNVVPDRDQSLLLSLAPAPRLRPKGAGHGAPRASSSAFWRFE